MHQEVKEKLPANLMPWEANPPLALVRGFKSAVGTIVVSAGYALYPHAVLLFASLSMGNQPEQLWRYHWTTREEAVRAAEQMCMEADEYLENFHAPRRPVEDLDFDDFIEHLHARLNNELH